MFTIVDLMIRPTSYTAAETLFYQGRIDATDWALYRFYWRNGAPRFSEIAAEFEIRGS